MSECIQLSFAVCRIGMYTVSNVSFCSTKCHENISDWALESIVELWQLSCTADGVQIYIATMENNQIEPQQILWTWANPLLGIYLREIVVSL